MTDSDQAARIAAMRARRGQAPIDLPVTRTQPVPVTHEQWAAPEHDRASIASAPAKPVRNKRPHVAAGARIIMTGFAASSVFGLTTVIAAANRPVTSPEVTPPVEGVVAVGPDATTTVAVEPGSSLPVQPGATVVLAIPAVGATTTVAVLPGVASASAAGAVPAPAPATPAPGTVKSVAPVAAGQVATQPAAPAVAAPAPAPTPAQAPAQAAAPAPEPVVTQPPAPAPAVTQPAAPVVTQPAPPAPAPAPVTTQAPPPPPPPPTTAKASGAP